MSDTPAIELKGISKAFGPVQANKDISIRVMPGTIHGIIGENGAGKSTLMSILYGFYKADAGEIWINGAKTDIPDSQAAIAAGIGMVFQHFKLVENFTVLENVVLGAEDSALLRPSLARARGELKRLAEEYELNVDPDAVIEDIGVGMQQRVEILKALYRGADILILDEPTGVLTPAEADHLFRILEGLKDAGQDDHPDHPQAARDHGDHRHRQRHAARRDDRDGQDGRDLAARARRADGRPQGAAAGREGAGAAGAQGARGARPARSPTTRAWSGCKGISFDVHAGEILGIAGVAGNGQSELLEVLGGYEKATGTSPGQRRADRPDRRQVRRPVAPRPRHRARARGPAARGPDHGLSSRGRTSPSAITTTRATTAGCSWTTRRSEPTARPRWRASTCARRTRSWPPRTSRAATSRRSSSRARSSATPTCCWSASRPAGVDIGAIEFIHQQIVELRDRGKAILLVSVELDEIMSLSDRIAVMFDGKIMGERRPDETDAKELGLLMAGITDTARDHSLAEVERTLAASQRSLR